MFDHFQNMHCSDEVKSTMVSSQISCRETDQMRNLEVKLGQMLTVVAEQYGVVKDKRKLQ